MVMATCGKLMIWLAASCIRLIGHDQVEVWVLCGCYKLSLPCVLSYIALQHRQGCPQSQEGVLFAGEKPPAAVKPPMAGEQPPAVVELPTVGMLMGG